MDILLANNNDIDMQVFGFNLSTTTEEHLAQKVRMGLLMRRGEWFANINEGIPYSTFFSVKGNTYKVESVMRPYIETIEGVKRVVDFATSFDKATRTLTIAVVIEADDGTIIGIQI